MFFWIELFPSWGIGAHWRLSWEDCYCYWLVDLDDLTGIISAQTPERRSALHLHIFHFRLPEARKTPPQKYGVNGRAVSTAIIIFRGKAVAEWRGSAKDPFLDSLTSSAHGPIGWTPSCMPLQELSELGSSLDRNQNLGNRNGQIQTDPEPTRSPLLVMIIMICCWSQERKRGGIMARRIDHSGYKLLAQIPEKSHHPDTSAVSCRRVLLLLKN